MRLDKASSIAKQLSAKFDDQGNWVPASVVRATQSHPPSCLRLCRRLLTTLTVVLCLGAPSSCLFAEDEAVEATGAAAASGESQVSALERKALDQRFAIKAGRMSTTISESQFVDGVENKRFEEGHDYWWSGSAWRHDTLRGGRDSNSFYKEFVFNGKNGFWSNSDNVIEFNTLSPTRTRPFADPRRIGFGYGFILEFTYSSRLLFVGGHAECPRQVSAGAIEDVAGTLVEYDVTPQLHVRMLFQEGYCDAPIAIEFSYLAAGDSERGVVHCAYNNDTWRSFGIPTCVTMRRYRNGVQLETRIESVEDFAPSIEADEQVFTMAALGVPAGKSVIDMAKGEQLYFDGQQPVAESSVPGMREPRRFQWNRMVAIILVVSSMIFAATALLRLKRSRFRADSEVSSNAH